MASSRPRRAGVLDAERHRRDDARQGRMAVSAGAKKAGTDALRAAGADVSDDDVASLVLKVRATLNAGRAPRSKLDEARRLEAALDPVAIRLALGNPEVPGSEMAEALWGFTEAATYATQAESRIRRVAADTDGWERIADRIWARAVGDDGGTLPTDWLLHLGIGLLLSSLVVVLGADSGRHRLAGAAVGLCGTVLLVRRVPERVVAWWARWRRRSAFAAALRSGGDGLDLTAAEDDCAAWDAKGAPTTKGGGAGATEVPTGPLHPPGLAALPPSPRAPPAEGVGGGTPPAKPGAQDLAALRAFGQGFHAPYAPADAVKLGREVQMVGATLREFQAQAATNVYWAWHFWERIAAVDGSMGLHPDLRRVLQTHGYVGAGTKSPPGGSLQQELDALLSSATAPHGGGMHASPGWAVAPVTQQQQEDSRWNLSLPPDLRRAAPEIYRTMRGAGAASARDWLSLEVTGQRHTAVWTDLWTAATNVDYLLGGCRTQSELLTRLASDDALELHLRRLASYVYEMRTKDKVGAAAMLAVRPPGSAADLAPTWLVTEATTHSKAEHQRDERPRMPVTGLPGSLMRALQWKEAELMNGMGRGSLEARPAGQREPSNDDMMLAWQLVQQYALQDAARYERDCRGLAPTGGQGTDLACDRGPQDAYTGERKGVSRHVMMCAAAVAEPPDDMVVDLLEALPDGERQYYSDELNVLDYSGKSGVLFEELEERFAFVGGSTSEYARYMMRADLPKDMWTFEDPNDVQAYCGFSCVPKKDPTKQRKVLMMCASNYVWADPHQRGVHGMHGGAAIASMCAPTDEWGVAAFDEDNAFTRLRVPAWMAKWQACPPIRACWVRGKLSQRLRDLVGPTGWVAPCYHRLAMGGSHSVHLLMTVNMAIIGRALLGVGARLGALAGAAEPAEGGASGAPRASPPEDGGLEADDLGDAGPEGAQQHRYDDDWLGQQSSCRAAPPSPSGYSVAEWLEAVSPLAQYPEGMCEALGALIVQTLAIFEQTGLGGTGWRRPPEADRSVTAWSSRSTTAPAVAVRNEDVLRGRGLVLDGPQMAFYLRVDDGVVMAGGSGCGPRATEKMHHLADALAEAGFVVTDRTEASDMQKVLGYAPQARPAQLRLPPKRARELVRQLEEMGATRTLHTEELRSLLGVWIWGALLRRELLCIPSAVFRLLERHPHQRVCTWATVRRELRATQSIL
ncbi:unnamed protein product [Prorocentrum cordatum]|uniref:Uncharacterized protein n=1 Tax=Prorocentrum cordatum TaxID=2364126 RepID=A0ABN9TJG7_9DINO|nr:unnamed protein product [Polarella glacialis]